MTTKKEPKAVEEFDVCGETDHVVVTIDGESHRFETQQALALRRELDACAINLNH